MRARAIVDCSNREPSIRNQNTNVIAFAREGRGSSRDKVPRLDAARAAARPRGRCTVTFDICTAQTLF
eukprot:1492518-Prymnesium_polylepis.1